MRTAGGIYSLKSPRYKARIVSNRHSTKAAVNRELEVTFWVAGSSFSEWTADQPLFYRHVRSARRVSEEQSQTSGPIEHFSLSDLGDEKN